MSEFKTEEIQKDLDDVCNIPTAVLTSIDEDTLSELEDVIKKLKINRDNIIEANVGVFVNFSITYKV